MNVHVLGAVAVINQKISCTSLFPRNNISCKAFRRAPSFMQATAARTAMMITLGCVQQPQLPGRRREG